MSQQDAPIPADDVEGHRRIADAERDETDDAEGHRRIADAERDETDDAEGHKVSRADTELYVDEGHMH